MALVMTTMALTLLTGLGTVLVVGTMMETAVAAAHRRSVEVFYAADAAVEFAIRDLAARADWDAVLTGAEWSAFTDGPPEGIRDAGTAIVDLTRASAEVEALLAARAVPPDGAARLYAYGRFDWLVPADAAPPPLYVCVWVAPRAADEAEGEERPVRELYLAARAFGTTGGQRTLLVALARPLAPEERPSLQVRAWEELQ